MCKTLCAIMKNFKIFIITCIFYISICNSKSLDENNINDEELAQDANSSLLLNSQDAEIQDHTRNVSRFINTEKDSSNASNDEEDDTINNYNEDKKTESILWVLKIKKMSINDVNITSNQELPRSFMEKLEEGLRKHIAAREEERKKKIEFFRQIHSPPAVYFNDIRERMEEMNAINKRFEDLEKITVNTDFNKLFQEINFTPATSIFNTRREDSNWWENRKLMKLIITTGTLIIILILFSLISLYLKCKYKNPSSPKDVRSKGTDEMKLPLADAMEKEFDC